MNFKDYINNPQGKANAVISNRNMYRELYTDKLNKIMVRENGKVDYTLFETSKFYLCHIKVPSEVIDRFYYDVVVQFSKKDNVTDLSEAEVKFYSNDPSFVFTFAHSFIKNKIFITMLEDRMSREAVKRVASEKNPDNQIGYVKSLYFAYLLMNKRGLFNPIKYKAEGKQFDERKLKNNIDHADKKINDRQVAGEELSKTKRASNRKEDMSSKRSRDNIIAPTSGTKSSSSNIGKINNTKRTNKIGASKSSRPQSSLNTINKGKNRR